MPFTPSLPPLSLSNPCSGEKDQDSGDTLLSAFQHNVLDFQLPNNHEAPSRSRLVSSSLFINESCAEIGFPSPTATTTMTWQRPRAWVLGRPSWLVASLSLGQPARHSLVMCPPVGAFDQRPGSFPSTRSVPFSLTSTLLGCGTRDLSVFRRGPIQTAPPGPVWGNLAFQRFSNLIKGWGCVSHYSLTYPL